MPIIPITYLEHICVQTFYSLDRTFIMSVISNSDAVLFSSLNQPWAGARWDGRHNALTGLGNGVTCSIIRTIKSITFSQSISTGSMERLVSYLGFL